MYSIYTYVFISFVQMRKKFKKENPVGSDAPGFP